MRARSFNAVVKYIVVAVFVIALFLNLFGSGGGERKAGYKFVVDSSGTYHQVLDEKGHGIPCQ